MRRVGGRKRLENQRIAREGVIGRTEGQEDRIRRRRVEGFGWPQSRRMDIRYPGFGTAAGLVVGKFERGEIVRRPESLARIRGVVECKRVVELDTRA